MTRIAPVAASSAGQVQAAAVPLAARRLPGATEREVPARPLLVARLQEARVARATSVPSVRRVAASLALGATDAAFLKPTKVGVLAAGLH